MDPLLGDWLSLFLRWAHVMLGIMWIGTSFFFVWLDMSLRRDPEAPKGVHGATWMVHGGGFYHAQKYLVAPDSLPKELHWFKYEAYFTWVTGFLLIVVIYYLGAEQFLIDRAVMELTPLQAIGLSVGGLAIGWFIYDGLCRSPLGRRTGPLAAAVFLLTIAAAFIFGHVFSGRAALMHVGAFIGTIMAANVFFVIIPNQKKVVAALVAGRAPDPALGEQAKQRSLHNNYLTLPVVLAMVSNHYPMLFDPRYGWLFVAGIIVLGALVRHYVNLKDSGRTGNWIDWLPIFAAGLALVLASLSMELSKRGGEVIEAGSPPALDDVVLVVQSRCASCHSATPADPHFAFPPKGIAFDTPEEIARYAPEIARVAVLSNAMPLANSTEMLEEERDLLAHWIESGAAE
jgi:uncharacterized membrane protein